MSLSIFKSGRGTRKNNAAAETGSGGAGGGYEQVDNSGDKTPVWMREADGDDDGEYVTPTWLQGGEERPPFDQEEDGRDATAIVEEDDPDDMETPSPSIRRKRYHKRRAFVCLTSSILLAFFVYSTIVRYNDYKVRWLVYYGLQAAIPAIFLVRYGVCCCATTLRSSLERLLLTLSAAMLVWSFVYIIWISHDLKKLDNDADDNIGTTEDLILELAGVLLGLLSASYHSILICYLQRINDEEAIY